MRKCVVAAALVAGLAWPAGAQTGGAQTGDAAKPTGKQWTYLALTDGTVGWEDGGVRRDTAANTARVNMIFYTNDPRPLPGHAVRKGTFTAPDKTFDYEMRIVTYECGGDALKIETSLYFSIIDERSRSVADGDAQPKQKANSALDQTVKKHICEGVKPDGAGEAFGLTGMVNAAATLEKRARGQL